MEHDGKHIPVGGQITMEAKNFDLLPQFIQDWAAKGFVRVTDLDNDGKHVGGPEKAADMTPRSISPISEVSGADEIDGEPG